MHLRFMLLPFLVYALPTFALMDFYGYSEITSKEKEVTQYKSKLLGYSELERSTLTIKPYGTYLDITEDGWISSDVNKLNVSGMTGDYMFKGTIPIPPNAVVTGLQTWRGEQLYRAVLRESKYITDNNFDDTATLQQSLDSRIALLQKHSESVFELTLARVKLGERIHIRIRYLLRPENTHTGLFSIPVLFHTVHGATPQHTGISVYANNKNNAFTLIGSNGSYRITDTTTTMLPYQASVLLQYSRDENSSLTTTEFTDGNYRGNYLAINTSVTDSIIRKLSKPIATVFIWRWNNPEPMTTFADDARTLSPYARAVINQASVIRHTINDLKTLGNSCALIHSVEGNKSYAFHSEKINSFNDSSAIDYLNTMNEMNLYDKYKNEETPPPGWVVQESSSETEIQSSRDAFIESLIRAQNMLEKTSETTFKHIIIISVGNPFSKNKKNLYEQLTLDHDDITVYAKSVKWLGVDIGASIETATIYPWSNYSFPPFTPSTIQLSINNKERPYTFPLDKNAWENAFTVTARTGPQWDTLFTWTGFDAEGEETAQITERPAIYRLHADSGLAKIWAGDNNHITEKDEVYPGGTFGILTKATYLQATATDKAVDRSESVPFLSDEEITAPQSIAVISKQMLHSNPPDIHITCNTLTLNSVSTFSMLYIYDLKGRLILSYNLGRAVRRKNTLIIPLYELFSRYTKGMYILKFTGKTSTASFQLINGRIR